MSAAVSGVSARMLIPIVTNSSPAFSARAIVSNGPKPWLMYGYLLRKICLWIGR